MRRAASRRHRIRPAPASLPATCAVGEYAAKLRTPFAVLGLRTEGDTLVEVRYLPLTERAQSPRDAASTRAAAQIRRYLRDPTHAIDVPVAPRGTAFQHRVWDAIARIPVGESRTYGEIARGLRSAPRAVGQACGANPLALVVPCHRVVGARGALGGFMNAAEGDPVAIKRWLLAHEGYRFGRS